MNTATVFNIQRFSLHDGPGIRTTVFMKGCPLRCSWCHNPESLDPRPEPMLNADHCVGCEACQPVCEPQLATRMDGQGTPSSSSATCLRCGACVEACPSEARQMSGRTWEVAELVAELQRDSVYYDESLGGVTFSGGEPLAATNAAFVIECLRELKSKGVHCALDTCGSVPTEILLDAAANCDLVLFDLKILDPDRHRTATGRDNSLILHNLKCLLEAGHAVHLRVPLIPGQTSDHANLEAAAEFVRGLNPRPPVHLLPYHATGADKYRRLGRANPLPGAQPLDSEALDECVRLFEDRGVPVQVGG